MGRARLGGTGVTTKAILGRHRAPPWFEDAKLGLFVHWGLYSVPAWAPITGRDASFVEITDALAAGRMPYAEWYWNSLRTPESATSTYHREHYGTARYESFREPFEAMLDHWDPDAWADLFAQAGARYVVFTAKHADGFLLWPSATRHPARADWQLEQDVVGQLADAVRARGMRFGLYYCGGMDWSFDTSPVVDIASVYSTVPSSSAYRAYTEAHLRELIDRYRPSVLWNDIALPPAFPRDELLVDYFSRVPDGVVNDRMRMVTPALSRTLTRKPARWLVNRLGRQAAGRGGTGWSVPYFADYATPEFTAEADIRPYKWETCRGLGNSFGYNQAEDDAHLLRPEEVIRGLVDTVSKNGNLLISVGPRGEDGVVPDSQAMRLRSLGRWLRTNGASVYSTRPWVRAEGRTDAGQAVRFTQSGGALFATVFGNPLPGSLSIGRIPTPGPVELLGHGRLPRGGDAACLRIEWPAGVTDSPAHVLRIGPPDASTTESPSLRSRA